MFFVIIFLILVNAAADPYETQIIKRLRNIEKKKRIYIFYQSQT